jgi:hypothetical protein
VYSHQEDEVTTHILATFGPSSTEDSEEAYKGAKEVETLPNEPKPPIIDTPKGRAYKHPVAKTDTLQGLSLKYNVKVNIFTLPSNISSDRRY